MYIAYVRGKDLTLVTALSEFFVLVFPIVVCSDIKSEFNVITCPTSRLLPNTHGHGRH